MRRFRVRPLARLPLLSFCCLFACVTPTQFDTEMSGLRQDLSDVQVQLDQAARLNEELEIRVADLLHTNEQLREAVAVQQDLLARFETIEQARVPEIAAQVAAQEGRVQELCADLATLRETPPMQALVKVEKGLSDLAGQVAINQRLASSNRDNLAAVSHALEVHENEFNRQMKLLAQYIEEQFLPLAEGFVAHLYQESRRMSVSAQELEEFARRVDPYKFTHLRPGFAETEKAESPAEAVPVKDEDE
ncbi:MAG: hypothetical protein HY812_01520 [Planctomycetes bacterium]|nr:hypothetical protein [Planctomycetota bacterium]